MARSREGTKQQAELMNAATDYANAAKDLRDHSSHQPDALYGDWPLEYKDRRQELLIEEAAARRALLTVAKKFVSNKRRKEIHALKAS